MRARQIRHFTSEGAIPNFRLNAVAKYWLDEKPVLKTASIIFTFFASLNMSYALCSLMSERYSGGRKMLARQIRHFTSEGAIPNFRLNAVAKYWLDEKPALKAASIIFTSFASLKMSYALCSLMSERYSSGVIFVMCLQ